MKMIKNFYVRIPFEVEEKAIQTLTIIDKLLLLDDDSINKLYNDTVNNLDDYIHKNELLYTMKCADIIELIKDDIQRNMGTVYFKDKKELLTEIAEKFVVNVDNVEVIKHCEDTNRVDIDINGVTHRLIVKIYLKKFIKYNMEV